MDALHRAQVNLELPREQLSSSLQHSYSEAQLADVRVCLFEEPKGTGLVNRNDVLVRRLKRAIGPSLSKKYADNVADIVYYVKNYQSLPRILLRNGKRSTAAYNSPRERRPFNSKRLRHPSLPGPTFCHCL